MPEQQRRQLSVVRDADVATTTTQVQHVSPLDDPASMDVLVDEVVARIEARVVDELERRGRRHGRGVF